MEHFKKAISFLLSLAMVLSVLMIPSLSNVYAADEYTYFNANMFKYNTKHIDSNATADNDFNKATYDLQGSTQGIYFNKGGDTTSIAGVKTDIKNENYNRFTNNWTGNGGNTCTGIVKSTLDTNGKIQFNYPQAGIFDTDSTAKGKSVYTNVGIPFKKDDKGYYYYDSTEYDVKFPSATPESGVNLVSKGGTPVGFYPFTQENKKTNSAYHFGMNMGVNFYMTSNGHIDGDESKDPIKFEFSGDDDVWVFIDGKLVLDIGGIHGAISGDINFADGKATVHNFSGNKTIDIYSEDVLGSNWKNKKMKTNLILYKYFT